MARALRAEELVPGKRYKIVIMQRRSSIWGEQPPDEVQVVARSPHIEWNFLESDYPEIIKRPYNPKFWKPIYSMDGKFVELLKFSDMPMGYRWRLFNEDKISEAEDKNPNVTHFQFIRNRTSGYPGFNVFQYFSYYGPNDTNGVEYFEYEKQGFLKKLGKADLEEQSEPVDLEKQSEPVDLEEQSEHFYPKLQVDVHKVDGGTGITRELFFVRLPDGKIQTFVKSTGKSNPKEQFKYTGLVLPIAGVEYRLNNTVWYVKLVPVAIDPLTREFKLGKGKEQHDPDTICIKPSGHIFKWEFFLLKDFVKSHSPDLWELIFDPESETIADVHQRRKLFKLFIFIREFRKMNEFYFAEEVQLECSCVLSDPNSIWATPGFSELKEFLLTRKPELNSYLPVRMHPKIRDNSWLIREINRLDAKIHPRKYVDLRTDAHPYDPASDGQEDDTPEQTAILGIAKKKVLTFMPEDVHIALQELIFSSAPARAPAHLSAPVHAGKHDRSDTHPNKEELKRIKHDGVTGESRRYTRKVRFTRTKRNKVRGRTLARKKIRLRTRKM